MTPIKNFEFTRDEQFKATFVWKAADQPVDLTGSIVSFIIKPVSAHPKLTYTVSNYITIDDPTTGTFILEIPDEETNTYRWTKGNYNITVEDSLGKKKKILKGVILVNRTI